MSVWLTRNGYPLYHARLDIIGVEAEMTMAAASTRPHQQMPRPALRARRMTAWSDRRKRSCVVI